MKKTWTALTALLLGAMLASPAFASDLLIAPKPGLLISPRPAAQTTEVTCPTIDGFAFAPVTSSLSGELKDTTPAFDRDSSTAYIFTAAEGKQTLSLYVTSYAPYALAAVGGIFDGLIPTMEIYGSNDYTLTEWEKVELSEKTEEKDGFTLTYTADAKKAKIPAYRFYRVDMTAAAGESIALKEFVLYRPEGKMLIPVYDTTDGGVDVDEEPIGYLEIGEDKAEDKGIRKPFGRKLNPIPKPFSV